MNTLSKYLGVPTSGYTYTEQIMFKISTFWWKSQKN